MSSLADCYHNHSTSAPILVLDNVDENEYNSSFKTQHESMMHKVKDVVSKLLHPSFLFSSNDDTTGPKRKRSDSVEENDDEQQIDKTSTNSHTQNHRSVIKEDKPQLTDDEDSNSRDVPSTEQQKKRRRTANYQHILETNSHHEDERTSPSSISTDSVITSSNTTPILLQTSIEQNHNERINRLSPSKQRFNIPSSYRGLTPNYDPSKSPLFAVGNRKTTTNVSSNEFSANHLLATSLVTRAQSSTSNSQQSPATLIKPTTDNNNRLLSNERQMFGVNYASINSRRLPYIERLRQRTLHDCIRLNRTLDNEPLSISTIEEHKSTPASPVPKRIKPLEKECGIQCDISIVEPSKKTQRTLPPIEIQSEALSVPVTEQSSNQTASSITIEKEQPPIPIIVITKPKVLGNVTPFSWPKFARAQEEYAKKYPEKCRADAVVPSIVEKSNVNTISIMRQQTNINTSTMPIFPFSSSCATDLIWKCPCCTKEHPKQTASCSLCHGINPNYRKLSMMEPTVAVEKESVSSNQLSRVTAKEPSISTPIIPITNPTTTKEHVSPIISPFVTTSPISTYFPSFSTTPSAFLPAITKTNLVSTAPIFGVSSPTTATEQNNGVNTAPISSSSTMPMFGIAPTVSSSLTTSTTENPVSTSASRLWFGTTPMVSPTTLTTGTVTTSNTLPLFGIATTKENVVTTSTPPLFGTTTFDKSISTSASNSFQTSTTFPSFPFVPSTSLSNTVVTSSTIPSVVPMTPDLPTSTPFGAFATTTPITTTTTATPVVSTVSSNQPASFAFAPVSSAPSLTTNTTTTSNLFGFSTVTPTSVTTTVPMAFPVASVTSAFPNPNNFTSASTPTTSVPPTFGSNSFSFGPASTATTTSSNPTFGFGANSPSRSMVPSSISSMNTNTIPSFGTTGPFGASPFSPFSNIGSSNPLPTLSFGSTTSATANTIQTSAAPFVSATSGFSFLPQSSTVPLFGSGPSALSSSGSSSTFGFGVTPAVCTTSAAFQSLSESPSDNLFSTQGFPDSTEDPAPLFNIGTGGSTPNPLRPILRAKRRGRN